MDRKKLILVFVIQETHLGQGTHTNIYAGKLKLKNNDDEGFTDCEEANVVLKELGAGHKDISVSNRHTYITQECVTAVTNTALLSLGLFGHSDCNAADIP